MIVLPLIDLLRRTPAGGLVEVAGPEVVDLVRDPVDWLPGRQLRSPAFSLLVGAGPLSQRLRLRAPSWALATPVTGSVRCRPDPEGGPGSAAVLEPGDHLLAAPGSRLALEAEAGAAVALFVSSGGACSYEALEPGERCGGLSWLIARSEAASALTPRDKVKIAEANLWRPEAPPGRWRPGQEIACEAVALSLFRAGAAESAHLHERSWEVYRVLEGELRVQLRSHRLAPWAEVGLVPGQLMVLAPGEAHLVQPVDEHLSMVLQFPPAISDRQAVSLTSGPPSLSLPSYDEQD